jgi:Flp pilus assembly protein TadG
MKTRTAATASRTSDKSRDAESGSVVIEFALVTPILMLVALGIVGFGSVFNQYIAL